MGEWIEVDISPEERRRLEVMADAHEVSLETILGVALRGELRLFENLGARYPAEMLTA